MFMCKVGIECTAGFIVQICLTRSIKIRADYSSVEFSNSTLAHLTCKVLCFTLGIKGKTLATFYVVAVVVYAVYVNLLLDLEVFAFTYT